MEKSVLYVTINNILFIRLFYLFFSIIVAKVTLIFILFSHLITLFDWFITCLLIEQGHNCIEITTIYISLLTQEICLQNLYVCAIYRHKTLQYEKVPLSYILYIYNSAVISKLNKNPTISQIYIEKYIFLPFSMGDNVVTCFNIL